MKCHILPNKVFWRLDLATGLSREFKPRANGLASLELLSYSEQLAQRFSFWHAWHVCFNFATCSHESLLLCTHLSNSSHSHTHTLPLHDSHLKYKQIWHGIKPTRWLIKFNLTISPFGYSETKP